MARSDEQIKKDIVDELYWDNSIDASQISVTVNKGIVSLAGVVPTYGELLAARTAAWNIKGVVGLIEDITVAYVTPPELPGDAEIENQVNTILYWDNAIDTTQIKVIVSHGIVVLEGTVDACWKKYCAEDRINAVRGIRKIENKLAVVPTEKSGDEAVAKNIVKALDREKMVSPEDVTVEVKDGIVTLSGEVPGRRAVDAAWRVVVRTAGVLGVENKLKIAV